MKKPRTTCRESAERLLSYREHSPKELRIKLMARGFSHQEITSCIEELQDLDILSEQRYLQVKLQSLIQKNYGPRHIQMVFEQQKIPVSSQQIEDAYTELGSSPAQQILNWVGGRRKLEGDKLKAKLWSRGFRKADIDEAWPNLD